MNTIALQSYQADSVQDVDTNRAIESALHLHRLGFNVTYMPYKSKYPFSRWASDTYTRLLIEDVPSVFLGLCNVGIIIHENIGILDVESRQLGEKYLKAMVLRRIPILGWYTPSGVHIAFRIDGAKSVKSIALNTKKDNGLVNAELRGFGKLVTAEGSVTVDVYTRLTPDNTGLPQSAFSHDVIPTIQADSLNFVETVNGKPFAIPYKALNTSYSAYADYLSNGANITEGNRNNALYLASVDANSMGLDESKAVARLTPLAVASGLTEREAVATIESGYESTPKHNRKPRRDVEAFKDFANGYDWTIFGRKKESVYRVFLAIIERLNLTYPVKVAYIDGFRASHRELSQISGISLKTVTSAVNALSDKKLITVKKNEHGVTLILSPKLLHQTTKNNATHYCSSFGENPNDVLSLTERAILSLLSANPDTWYTVQAVCLALSRRIPYTTAKRVLSRFVDLRLVAIESDGKRNRYSVKAIHAKTIEGALQTRIEHRQKRIIRYRKDYQRQRENLRARRIIRERYDKDMGYRVMLGLSANPHLRIVGLRVVDKDTGEILYTVKDKVNQLLNIPTDTPVHVATADTRDTTVQTEHVPTADTRDSDSVKDTTVHVTPGHVALQADTLLHNQAELLKVLPSLPESVHASYRRNVDGVRTLADCENLWNTQKAYRQVIQAIPGYVKRQRREGGSYRNHQLDMTTDALAYFTKAHADGLRGMLSDMGLHHD